MTDLDSFLGTNEQLVNKILGRTILCVLPGGPLLYVGSLLNIFPNINRTYILILTIFMSLASVMNFWITKTNSYTRLHKYILLTMIQIIVLSISLGKGLFVVFVFGAATFLSCLYFNEALTLQVSFTGGVCIAFSYWFRTYFYKGDYSWGITFGIGALFEYFIFCVFCFYLTREIHNALNSIYQHRKKISQIQEQLLNGFANIIEAKDTTTGEHIKRTSSYVRLICNKLQEKNIYPDEVNPSTTELMVRAAPFHDLGKLAVPDEILNKPGKLTPEEFSIIQKHPNDGAEFIVHHLRDFDDVELLEYARDMALCHHERMDGCGYPNRLIEEEIPISARVMAVADILDALLSKRPYKDEFTLETSFGILRDLSGCALDPQIVNVILESGPEIEIIKRGGFLNYA